jgi:phage gp36-like protein
MAYAARTDMATRYGEAEIAQLEADSNKGPAAVTAALADAAAEIDGYLGRVYSLPLPAGRSFPILKWASCDIARYRLWESKINDEKDTIYTRYRRVVKVLEDIASGLVALSDADGAPYQESGASITVISPRKEAFTSRILDMMDYGDS